MRLSKEVKLTALLTRKKAANIDNEEVLVRIEENAANGEFELCMVHNKKDEYPTVSAEFLQELKDKGYKIDLWYKQGWDDLHRYYKGAFKITWYK